MADFQVASDDLLLTERSAGDALQFRELVVSKVLYSEAYADANDRKDHGNDILAMEQRQTEQAEPSCDAVQDQDNFALREASVQESVMNVLTVAHEERLVIHEAAHEGEADIKNRQAEGHHGNGHSDHGLCLLRASQTECAQQESNEQAA
jgi:hypothetical protein